MTEEVITLVLPLWTICPQCLAVDEHNKSPWRTSFPHKEGCASKIVVIPNIASDEGVRLTAKAFMESRQ